jgi:hypothetical protein
MTTAEILAELEARNIKVAVVGGRLRVEASPGAAPAWLLAALVEHRAKLLAWLEAGAAETAPAALRASGAGDVPASPPLPVGPGGTIRIPLDDLVLGDFLARNKLRVVDGAAYPDGRTYRPTIYLAEDDAATR